MGNEHYIAITDFCISHNISSKFILELHDYGLIELISMEKTRYIPLQQLPRAEKILRLYSDLEINLEGIAVINHLLDRIEKMQDEIIFLKNKLHLYEE
ncbi:MerR family transcriptional regulator [Arenibacter sp. 6A1]|uniref:chaperone modulator CbpM n=1 Tax=Arenibacter sp. 6A1 TaxID=2720391 RepID=UPI001444AF1B|nr:chaperone modulator CbpM [Arenibacter sp. 6A1]NKI27154.1 MerR family transcriptional regulator [Arenibacter sp. 6A1]